MEMLAATADHAARGKQAAVAEGYWSDGFVRCLTRGAFDSSPGPLINRGQYARVAAIASAMEQFLAATAAAGEPAQIVSLGAGFDTCFWQLHAAGAAPNLYVELDQDEIVRRKCSLIASQPALLAALPEGAACVTRDGIASGASGYRLLACDLNDVAQLEGALSRAGWSAEQPTLLVAECVLVYMVPEAARAVLDFFGALCRRAVLIAYEMAHPDDAFGRQMLDNLRRRGCPLLSLPAVPDGAAQEERLRACGWDRAEAMEMLSYFDEVIAPCERQRVCRLAMLDELEEWRLLLSHYCVALAVSDDAEKPLFAHLALRLAVTRPPLEGLRAAAAPAAPSPPNAARAPPLGDTFREEDEAATWSDEDALDAPSIPVPTAQEVAPPERGHE